MSILKYKTTNVSGNQSGWVAISEQGGKRDLENLVKGIALEQIKGNEWNVPEWVEKVELLTSEGKVVSLDVRTECIFPSTQFKVERRA